MLTARIFSNVHKNFAMRMLPGGSSCTQSEFSRAFSWLLYVDGIAVDSHLNAMSSVISIVNRIFVRR